VPGDVIPTGHSPLGMSVLERRFMCPGSMAAEAGRPDRPSTYAKRGTDLHAVAAECLISGANAEDMIPDDYAGVEIVQPYLDVVREAHDRLGGRLLVEHTFWMRDIHDLFRGTVDAVIVAPPIIWAGDLKTGAGHAVPIRRPDGRLNWQLGGYGLGAMQSVPSGITIKAIELCVIQPRLGPPQHTVASISEMIDLAGDLVGIARAAIDPDAKLVPGDHCTFCRAAGECPALRAQALAAAQADFADPPDPLSLSTEELGTLLTRAEIVETWLAAIRAHAYALAQEGHTVPGWKLVQKRGRRVWVDEQAAQNAMYKTGIDADACVTVKVVSPTQAEKAFKQRKIPLPTTWSDLVTMSDPGTALVQEADKRPALEASNPASDFTIEPEGTR
jgi:hypothetical protein